MNRCVVHPSRVHPRLPDWVRLAASLILLAALAGCGNHPAQHARKQYNPSRYYPPPGPREDPWGPYIREASGRFGVPELWIRRVMRQESGGQEDVISWAGAMGLMQVMPDTYDGLRVRYGLGDDPFDPHNNILAGTAYLHEMHDRFGAPGFLAAYNAGPNRLDRYLNNGTPLPAETVNYVASIAPFLGPETAMSGPLAVYAGPATMMASRATPSGCDPDAAYNPDGPCAPFRPGVPQPFVVASAQPFAAASVAQPFVPTSVAQPFVAASVAPAFVASNCDPDAAYDPARPCRPLPSAPAPVIAQAFPQPSPRRPAEYAPAARPRQEMTAQPAAFTPWTPPGRWAIQVGAFANLATAQSAAETARSALPDLLRTAKVELPATTPFGSQVAFRARLFGLSPTAAADACARLGGRGMACITVPPPRDSF
jgi:D-alanyl-D-alanine carboxypeptidase